jgi:hypothetical protein
MTNQERPERGKSAADLLASEELGPEVLEDKIRPRNTVPKQEPDRAKDTEDPKEGQLDPSPEAVNYGEKAP